MANLAVSSIHASVCVIGWLHTAMISCYIPGESFLTNELCYNYTSPGMQLFLMFSLSYFVSDLYCSYVVFGRGAFRDTCIHHCISFTGTLSTLILGRYVGVVSMNLLFSEISTVFLNFVFITKGLDAEEYNKVQTNINSLCLLVLFCLVRIFWLISFLCYQILPVMFRYDYDQAFEAMGSFKPIWMVLLVILYIILCIMNTIWFFKLYAGYKKLRIKLNI